MKNTKPPVTYRNRRKPPIIEAMRDEGCVRGDVALASLERKGYFEAHARPWGIGERDRGMGRIDVAILDRFGVLVARVEFKSDAELIIAAVNAYKPKGRKARKKS